MDRYCINCGAKLKPGAHACAQCGAPVDGVEDPTDRTTVVEEIPPRVCPSCGAPVEDDATFCTNCGTSLVGPGASGAVRTAQPQGASSVGASFAAQPAPQPMPQAAPASTFPGPMPAAPAAPKRRMDTPLVAAISVAAVLAIALIGVTAYMFGAGSASKNDTSSDPGSTVITTKKDASSKSDSAAEKDASTTQDAQPDTSQQQSQQAQPTQQAQTQSAPVQQSAPAPVQTAPTTTTTSGYILPESSSRVYSVSELASMGLSKSQLELARNEIYARHGRGFVVPRIRSYFQSQSWYRELYSASDFDNYHSGELSQVEWTNIANIKKLE